MAMANPHLSADEFQLIFLYFSNQMPIYRGFAIAMFDYRRSYFSQGQVTFLKKKMKDFCRRSMSYHFNCPFFLLPSAPLRQDAKLLMVI
jgi:hypothetical protein